MNKVQAQTKSVKELLSGVKYGIDFYQREYVWGRRHVEDLLNDLAERFLESFDEQHERTEVSKYPHYFLGTIITISESGGRYIVDGQQRLTTITLLLILIHHLSKSNPSVFNVSSMVFSSKFGQKSFNLEIPERRECMDALYKRGRYDAADHPDLSVRNLVARYDELDELFPETVKDGVLPYFVDWLVESVDFVEIEAQSDDDAFTIFETMNDRGVNLSQTDMLKGYLLANINSSDAQQMHEWKSQANDEWRGIMRDLADLYDNAAEDFFKTWLRAKHAENTRERKKGAKNLDFELIDKYHRWTRDNQNRIGLERSADFYDFITRQIKTFSRHFIDIQRASWRETTGSEALFYNQINNFTLQYLLALAPLRLDDDGETIARKIRLVATFADIFLARRMAHMRHSGYSTLQYTMFNIAKRIRNARLEQLRVHLLELLDSESERFQRIDSEGDWPFHLNKRSGRKIRYLLARMTSWIERECGKNTTFSQMMWDSKGRLIEIEHIWANKYEDHQNEFDDKSEFQRHRNFFGALVLLPPGTNQSFGDMTYEDKLPHYLKQNLLAASLHPKTYEKNPNFTKFVKRNCLPFVPHERFDIAALHQRRKLYRQICEQIWSPDRLNDI